MRMIVVDGGPGGGKTTINRVLQDRFAGRALFVPEAATVLLGGGFPRPGRGIENWSQEWQDKFQAAVFACTTQLEEVFVMEAKRLGIKNLVCDRGRRTGVAYAAHGDEGLFLRRFNLNSNEENERYFAVLHLQSTAIGAPEAYGTYNNDNRFEPVDVARKLESRTLFAWREHPNRKILNCEGGIEGKIHAAIEFVGANLE
ncbi:MAG: AAA family ATPase [bacterium]